MFGTNYNDHRVAMGYSAKSDQEADEMFYKYATWTRKFAWLPHRCELTRKIIWFQHGYRGHMIWYGEWSTDEYRWHDLQEHLFWTLKGPYG